MSQEFVEERFVEGSTTREQRENEERTREILSKGERGEILSREYFVAGKEERSCIYYACRRNDGLVSALLTPGLQGQQFHSASKLAMKYLTLKGHSSFCPLLATLQVHQYPERPRLRFQLAMRHA